MSGVESSLFKGLWVLESWRPRYITSFNIFTASSSPSIFKYILNSFPFPWLPFKILLYFSFAMLLPKNNACFINGLKKKQRHPIRKGEAVIGAVNM